MPTGLYAGAVAEYLRIGEVAQALGVSVDTLRRWEAAGRVTFERRGNQQVLPAADLAPLIASLAGPDKVSSARNRFAGVVVSVERDGVMAKVEQAARGGTPMQGAEGLSVRQELQADCFAGVWANHAQQQLNWLEPGDIDAALNAANQIGDDTLQKQARGYVVPDSFTHGSSAERVRWFKAGFAAGQLGACDTFAARTL